MTGDDIRKIRSLLDIDQYVLAKVLGVHVSTVVRWESHTTAWAGNPLHEKILEALKKWCKDADPEQRGLLAARLRGRAYNTLSALHALLGVLQ